MIRKLFKPELKTIDAMAFMLVASCTVIAIIDKDFRNNEYANLATIFVSGYIGQLIPNTQSAPIKSSRNSNQNNV